MAAAITLQPPFIHPRPVPIAPSPAPHARPAISQQNMARSKSISARGEPQNIRARRDRPCDCCRRRRSRCVIHEGNARCLSCQTHDWDCTFVESPQPRKRKLDGEGNPLRPMKKKSFNPADNSARNSQGTRSSSGSGTDAQEQSNSLYQVQEYDFSEVQGHYLGRYVGGTSEFEPLLFRNIPFDTHGESALSTGILMNLEECGPYMVRPEVESDGYEQEALNDVESFVHPYGPTLLDLYFGVVHPSYPVVDQNVFRSWYEKREGLSPDLLAAVYILAAQWWDHDERLSAHAKPNLQRLVENTMKRIRDSFDRPSISAIQAALILSQLPGAHSPSLTAQLVTTGFDLGLHLDSSNWNLPLWQLKVRKRLAWALYMQDKWGSVIYGRPSHISSANWAVPTLTVDDFENPCFPAIKSEDETEVSEVEKGRLQFQQMVFLTLILSDILESFYTLSATDEVRSAGGNGTRLILDRAKPVQIRLKEWFTHLPPCLKMDSPVTSAFSTTGSLHIAYFATEITLHRSIIRSLPTHTTYLTHICRQAAKTRLISALDFTNRLRPAHLRSFWLFYTPSTFALVATFGNLLRATAPCAEESKFYEDRLGEYHWTLGVSMTRTRGVEGGLLELGAAINALEASNQLLDLWPPKPLIASLPIAEPPPPPVQAPLRSVEEISPPREEDEDDDDDDDIDDDDDEDNIPELQLHGPNGYFGNTTISTGGLMSPATSAESNGHQQQPRSCTQNGNGTSNGGGGGLHLLTSVATAATGGWRTGQ
ncbi:MAG: Fungal specific transcription factor [Cirrosporium novae-zelandiae]|nr:MAG: Fungal specific transcription factor [Cirrosporium novae-zelandiae]